MPQVTAAQPNIGGTLCESSVIPFLVPRCKFWLMPAPGVPCSNAANVGEHKTWDSKWILHLAKFRQGATAPRNVYIPGSLPAQEMAKHRARFGWPPASNVAAVTKRRRKNPLKFSAVPQTRKPISAVSRSSSRYCEGIWRRYCCLTSFSNCWYMPQLRRYSSTKWCDDTQMVIFFRNFCVLFFQRAACSTFQRLECGPMPIVMAALPNTGGALRSMQQSLADAHY